MERILVVDDESGIRSFLRQALAHEGYRVDQAQDGAAALTLLEKNHYHLMLTDMKMPGISGMELLATAKKRYPELEVVVLTAHGSVDTAVEAMKLGAYDYLQKPLSSPEELRLLVGRALERRRLLDGAERDRTANSQEMVARDPAMLQVLAQLEKVAATDTTVLICGESGTGKEVAARRVHSLSGRAQKPFVAVNCAALSAQLLESELFGHEKGAFTGAHERRRGRFEMADTGTLFLDEVAEIKPELQAKLLRVLQERKFERVGGQQTIEVDIRLVAATNRDLKTEMEQGRFREDLYHRLAVFPFTLPPLRQRVGDILPLAEHLLKRIGARLGRPDLLLAERVRDSLMAYPWPGNVRELANVLERAAILCDGNVITSDELVLDPSSSLRPPEAQPEGGVSLKDLERQAIKNALASTGGHRKKTAAMLGIGLRTLYVKIKDYGLE